MIPELSRKNKSMSKRLAKERRVRNNNANDSQPESKKQTKILSRQLILIKRICGGFRGRTSWNREP